MTTLPPSPDQPVVRLSTPPEIVRAIPSLLGFHPSASLVVLGLAGSRQRLRMTLRIDLPAPGTEAEAAEQVAVRLSGEAVSACVVVLFTDSPNEVQPADADAGRTTDAGRDAAVRPRANAASDAKAVSDAGSERAEVRRRAVAAGAADAVGARSAGGAGSANHGTPHRKRAFLPGAPVAYAVEDALGVAGLEVRELLRAEGGRWWSYACDRPCCPPEGLSVGSGPTTLLEVLRVASGRPVFTDRAELVASARRSPGEPTDALNAAIQAREDEVAAAPWGPQAARDIADLHALLTHDAARALASPEPAAPEVWPSGPPASTAQAPDPWASAPQPSDPGSSGPGSSGPGSSGPGSSGPGSSGPGPSGPGPSGPGLSAPQPSDPGASDPLPSDPLPSGPQSTGSRASDPHASDAWVSGSCASDPQLSGSQASGSQASDPRASGPRVSDPWAFTPRPSAPQGSVSGPTSAASDGGHDDATVAFVAVALTRGAVRDASFAWTGGPLAEAATALWAEVARRVPPPYGAAPATLLAVRAYRRGDGALADAYLRRALDDDPDYRMADLVLTSLENGFRPTDMESALGLDAAPRTGQRGTRSAPGPDGGADAR